VATVTGGIPEVTAVDPSVTTGCEYAGGGEALHRLARMFDDDRFTRRPGWSQPRPRSDVASVRG